jgi:hypothetical protein
MKTYLEILYNYFNQLKFDSITTIYHHSLIPSVILILTYYIKFRHFIFLSLQKRTWDVKPVYTKVVQDNTHKLRLIKTRARKKVVEEIKKLKKIIKIHNLLHLKV